MHYVSAIKTVLAVQNTGCGIRMPPPFVIFAGSTLNYRNTNIFHVVVACLGSPHIARPSLLYICYTVLHLFLIVFCCYNIGSGFLSDCLQGGNR